MSKKNKVAKVQGIKAIKTSFNNSRSFESENTMRITVWAENEHEVMLAIDSLRNPRVEAIDIPVLIMEGVYSINVKKKK